VSRDSAVASFVHHARVASSLEGITATAARRAEADRVATSGRRSASAS
jgi:hypothetical protein